MSQPCLRGANATFRLPTAYLPFASRTRDSTDSAPSISARLGPRLLFSGPPSSAEGGVAQGLHALSPPVAKMVIELILVKRVKMFRGIKFRRVSPWESGAPRSGHASFSRRYEDLKRSDGPGV